MSIPFGKVAEILQRTKDCESHPRKKNYFIRRANGRTAQLEKLAEYNKKAIRHLCAKLEIPLEMAREVVPDL